MKTLDRTKMGIVQCIDYIENRLSASIYRFSMETTFGTIFVEEETEDFDLFHPVSVRKLNNSPVYHVQIGYSLDPRIRHLRIVEAMQWVVLSRIAQGRKIPQDVVDALTIVYLAEFEHNVYPTEDVYYDLLSHSGIIAKLDPMVQATTEKYVEAKMSAAMKCIKKASENAELYIKLRGTPNATHRAYTMALYGLVEILIPGTIKPKGMNAVREVVVRQYSETIIRY